MSLGDELEKIQGSRKPQGPPAGWSPRVEYDDRGGELVTPSRPVGSPPLSYDEVLRDRGLDPAEWIVTGVRHSQWQQREGGEWLEAHKVTFAPKPPNSPELVQADIDELLAGVQKWKRPAIRAVREQPSRALRGGPRGVFVYALSDFQLGKGEGGGTPATVERILGSLGNGLRQLEDLRRLGHQIDTVVLPTLGDMVEQCHGFYPMQAYQADLNMREQRRLGWQLVMRHVHEFSQVADHVLLTGIAGNHGETRNGDGKAFTTFDDSDDLLLLDAVAEIVAAAAGYDNIEVQLPDRDPLTHSFIAEGTVVGLAHGHQFTKGTGSAMKAYEWWKGQALGSSPVADANILLTGHFHSLSVSVFAENRTHIQAPTQDGGSYWYTSATGLSAPTGALTLTVGQDYGPLGWDNLRVV